MYGIKERRNNRVRYERDYSEKNGRMQARSAYSAEKPRPQDRYAEYPNMSSYERYYGRRPEDKRADKRYDTTAEACHTAPSYQDNRGYAPRGGYQPYYQDRQEYYREDNRRYADPRYMDADYDERYDGRYAARYEREDDYGYYHNDYDNRPDDRRRQRPKKAKLNLKTKILIGVYFAIIILITTLILVNAIPNANADSSYTPDAPKAEISDSALNKGINGENLTLLDPTAPDYNNGAIGNWFDDMCDWIENIVG